MHREGTTQYSVLISMSLRLALLRHIVILSPTDVKWDEQPVRIKFVQLTVRLLAREPQGLK